MSKIKDDEQYAFPQPVTPSGYELNHERAGLTKREWFAAQALPAVATMYVNANLTEKGAAELAVRVADALIKELEKK